ncbi:MAG TPA: single-stranded-DNA-specific exonuclease RecJ [Bacillota bacterium]|nr:single-stranded-DNA-specific exonuclease RecJ [Bacillota bacterium]
MAKWVLKGTKTDIKALAGETGLNPLLTHVLVNRGLATPGALHRYVQASLDQLYDPLLMKDMAKGTELIGQAIREGRSIAVFGDYDVDGVMSTVILVKALQKLGARVTYHIPDREAEGYGMSVGAVDRLVEKGVEVILTCDNGIAALEPISHAKSLGLTVVVVDHHEVRFTEEAEGLRRTVLPEADAIVNPKQEDCPYPFKVLCAGGIAFKFISQLYVLMGRPREDAHEALEFVALATVCDVVDLLDENRILVRHGLEQLNQTNNPGLRALIKVTGLEGKKLGAYHLGFILGPCINASGRLEVADLAVELFLSEDDEEVREIAAKLNDLNNQRREMTASGVEKVTSSASALVDSKNKVLVIYESTIHESIAGIIAGKVKEKFNLPTIILTQGREFSKGSGRSIERYNLFEELMRCRDLLAAFGGHPLAAGLSLNEENIVALRDRLNQNCQLTDDDVIPVVKIDKQLGLEHISYSLADQLTLMEPFGKGNSTPVFGARGVVVEKYYFVGKQQNILKLACRVPGRQACLEAISFDGGDRFRKLVEGLAGELVLDIVFSLGINEFGGKKTLQLQLRDFRLAAGCERTNCQPVECTV